jgi:hypothetical protein
VYTQPTALLQVSTVQASSSLHVISLFWQPE